MDSDTGSHKDDRIPFDGYEDEEGSPMGFLMFCAGVMFILFGAAAIVLAINYN